MNTRSQLATALAMPENPPHRVASQRVFRWWDYALFSILTVIALSAISYFLLFWLSPQYWIHHPVVMSIITLMLIVVLSNNLGRWMLLPFMRRPLPVSPRSGWRVAAVTTFVPGSEPIEMLEKTLRALTRLDYPHDTWVLDEGDDERVKTLCLQLGIYHFSRRNSPHWQKDSGTFKSASKHGNYNAWLHEIGFQRYDILAMFDPDHVPHPDFLSSVLGYFEDPSVSYVQLPQAYYNQEASFIARGAAEETYAYYSSIQMASYGLGYPVVIGSHNTHRVAALQEIGGFPVHDAEDLLVTLLYRSRGWQGVYVPRILARGLTPVCWNSYLTQQRRWARSVLDIKLRIYPRLSGNLSLRARLISFLHGFNYLHRSLVMFVSLVLLAFMLLTRMSLDVFSLDILPRLAIMYAALQLCEFYRQRFYLDSRSEWGLPWRVAVLHFAKWPYFFLALCDVLFRRDIPYALTRKVKDQSARTLLFRPHMSVAVSIAAAWIVGMVTGPIVDPFLHIAAGLVVAGSVLVVLTERFRFPDPYDQQLWRHVRSY